VPAYGRLDELISDSRVTGCYVLTPNACHTELAVACLNAGKHVVIEKPTAVKATEIQEIEKAAGINGRVALPCHNYAYIPEFTRLRAAVRSGALGAVRAVWVTFLIRHPPEVPERYGGVIEDMMVHLNYLAIALLGVPSHLTAGITPGARPGTEDQAWMALEYPGGTNVQLFASLAVDDNGADPWTFIVKALGTEGCSSLSWRSTTVYKPINEYSALTFPAYVESFVHVSRAFRDVMTNPATELPSTIRDAATCNNLVAAAYRSVEDGTRVAVEVSS
jgi:predicted dehydrogenase